MKYIYLLLVLFLFSCEKNQNMKTGNWHGYLFWNSITQEKEGIPFELQFSEDLQKVFILNGEEQITENNLRFKGDSLFIYFPIYHNELRGKIENKTHIQGGFYALGTEEKVANFSAYSGAIQFPPTQEISTSKFRDQQNTNSIVGKWEIKWEGATEVSALGVFHLKKNQLHGSILSPSGDYRFLTGYFHNKQLKLFAFNGGTANLFNASMQADGTLKGERIDKRGNIKKFSASFNPQAQMPIATQQTQFENPEDAFIFNWKDIQDNSVSNLENTEKVYIIQLAGTWCPNCYDETKYFLTDLYPKYHEKGLEIVALYFESKAEENKQIERIAKVKEELNIVYASVLGGSAKPEEVKQFLPRLENFSAYPTILILNKKNQVVHIDAGFSGPGTGIYFEEYGKKMEQLITQLLAE